MKPIDREWLLAQARLARDSAAVDREAARWTDSSRARMAEESSAARLEADAVALERVAALVAAAEQQGVAS